MKIFIHQTEGSLELVPQHESCQILIQLGHILPLDQLDSYPNLEIIIGVNTKLTQSCPHDRIKKIILINSQICPFSCDISECAKNMILFIEEINESCKILVNEAKQQGKRVKDLTFPEVHKMIMGIDNIEFQQDLRLEIILQFAIRNNVKVEHIIKFLQQLNIKNEKIDEIIVEEMQKMKLQNEKINEFIVKSISVCDQKELVQLIQLKFKVSDEQLTQIILKQSQIKQENLEALEAQHAQHQHLMQSTSHIDHDKQSDSELSVIHQKHQNNIQILEQKVDNLEKQVAEMKKDFNVKLDEIIKLLNIMKK